MAADVNVTNLSTGIPIKCEEFPSGTHIQEIKILGGGLSSTQQIPGDSSAGLFVQVKNIPQVAVSSMPAISGTVTVTTGTVSISGPVQASGTVSVSGTALVTVVPGASISTVGGTVAVSVVVPIQISTSQTIGTVVTLLGTVAVNVVAGGAGGGSVTTSAPSISATGQVMWLAGGQSTTAFPVFVSQINAPAAGGGSVTTSAPSISATGQVMWIAGGQSTTAFPVVVTGTVSAGAGTTVVSVQNIVGVTTAASVSVTGLPVWLNPTQQIVVSGLVGQSITGSVNIVSNVTVTGSVGISNMPAVSISSIVPVTTAASVSVSGLPVWWNPTAQVVVSGLVGHSITGSVNIVSTAIVTGSVAISGTGLVSVVPGVSVTIQQGASVSLPAFSGVTATSGVVASSQFGVPVYIAGGQSIASDKPVWITGTVAAGAGTTVVSVTGSVLVSGTVSLSGPIMTTTQAAVTGIVVWLAPTQTMNLTVTVTVTNTGTVVVSTGTITVSGAVAAVTTQTAATGAGVWFAPTQSISVVSTVATVLGTVSVGGTINAIPIPTRAAFLAQVSSTVGISAGTSLLFTVWTGSTLAGAGQTQYPVPAGKYLYINAIYGALGSTASTVLNSCQLQVLNGASGSQTSANQATCGQAAIFQMNKATTITQQSLIGLNAVIGPQQTMGLFFTMASSITVSQFLIQGYLEG